MTKTEKRELMWRGAMFGAWNAGTFFGPFFFLSALPSPLNWIYALAVLVIGLAFYPMFLKMQHEFVASTVWARQQGLVPDQFRTPRWLNWLVSISIGLALGVAIHTSVLAPYWAVSDAASPEIPQGSYVLVYKRATAYETGDIVVYRTDGKAMLGRVAQAGPVNSMLQIERRNHPPQPLFMFNVVGKVVFNTRAVAGPREPSRMPLPASNQDPSVLSEPPKLRFLAWNETVTWAKDRDGQMRLMPAFEGAPWHSDGTPVKDPAEQHLMTSLYMPRMNIGDLPAGRMNPSYLYLWFSHPAVDSNSFERVTLLDAGGQPKPLKYPIGYSQKTADRLGWLLCGISPGNDGQLPATASFRLEYSLGPWKTGGDISGDFRGSMPLGDHWTFGSIGQNAEGRTFISLTRLDVNKPDTTQHDFLALTRDGRAVQHTVVRGSSSGELASQTFEFPVKLDEVKAFRHLTRPIQSVEFKNVPLAATHESRLQFRLVADANDTAPAETLADPDDPTGKRRLRLRKEVLLDESAVTCAAVVVSPTGGVAPVSVEVNFSAAGGKRFAEITGASIGKRLAVVFDGQVLSAPTIRSVICDKAVITGNFTPADVAETIAKALNPINK